MTWFFLSSKLIFPVYFFHLRIHIMLIDLKLPTLYLLPFCFLSFTCHTQILKDNCCKSETAFTVSLSLDEVQFDFFFFFKLGLFQSI